MLAAMAAFVARFDGLNCMNGNRGRQVAIRTPVNIIAIQVYSPLQFTRKARSSERDLAHGGIREASPFALFRLLNSDFAYTSATTPASAPFSKKRRSLG